MSMSRRRRVTAALAAVGLVVAAVGNEQLADAAPGNGHAYGRAKQVDVAESAFGSYIAVLESEPLVGEFDQAELGTAAAESAAADLVATHDALLAAVGAPVAAKSHSYVNALNGFSAFISHDQAVKLASLPGVAMVVPDELQQPQTDVSGDFLGLTAAGAAYDSGLTGEDIVIGVIDTGIWPEHPSFADDGTYDAAPIAIDDISAEDYTGVVRDYAGCDFGATTHTLAAGYYDDPFTCNDKLIGARYVLDTYIEAVGLTDVEYSSARDSEGHGTHTASTAGGNAGVEASIFGIDRGTVSGIAPRARVVAYKALGAQGGTSADLAQAIDLAVFDGVDVINYSIGSSSFAMGADDVAFLFAAQAGVYVATSNGNAGPGAATTGSPASVPWVTSVGAATHDRTFNGAVTIGLTKNTKKPGNPVTLVGASVTAGTGVVPIVDAADYGNEYCESTIPFRAARSLQGKLILCKRGINARIDKSLAVYQVGGAGMVLYNTFDADTLITDNHWVPSVHLNYTNGLAVKDYIHSAGSAYAQLAAGATAAAQPSVTAAFSSRGPNLLSGDIIKPDVTAPGVNILAGQTPTTDTGPNGEYFQSISGTSMSSPHVAGLYALFAQAHPGWSPAVAKSAIMTTARQDVFKEDGTTPADPFDMGAGFVDPSGAPTAPGTFFNPGIVYNTGFNNYLAWSCGANVGLVAAGTCTALANAGFSLDASDLNLASIGIAELAGSQAVTRRITNVSAAPLVLTPTVEAPAGYAVAVTPPTINVAAGASASFTVTITNESAPVGEWAFGSLTLAGGGYAARSPIAVKGVALAAPGAVDAAIADGGTSFDVTFGYTGVYAAEAYGLTPRTSVVGTVGQDPDQTFAPGDVGNGATAHEITVTDETMLRIHIPQVDPGDAIDLDLFVFGPDGALVGQSTNGGTNETVDVVLPAAGTYTAFVHGWGVGAAGATTDYDFQTWLVPLAPGTLTATGPASATAGATEPVTLTWPTDLDPTAGPYLGLVVHASDAGPEGVTIVDVD